MLSHWIKITQKVFIIGCVVLFMVNPFMEKLYAQDPFAKIVVLKGSNAIIGVNTLDQITNGVTLSNWSKIELYFNISSCDGWELTVSADNVALVSATDSIPLTSLIIEPVVTKTDGSDCTINPIFSTPKTTDTWLLMGTGKTNVYVEFLLTYKLGTAAPLLNYDSGYYIVGLSLNLTPINYIP